MHIDTETLVNAQFLRGHLGKDPVFHRPSGGDEVCFLELATNPRDIPDGNGGWAKRKADWISVSVFKPSAVKAVRDLGLVRGAGVFIIASVGQRDSKPDSGDGSVRKEHVLSVASRYDHNGVWAWSPKNERQADKG